jgi:[ribosomal protein S5]-alanine N-acetyltransferase
VTSSATAGLIGSGRGSEGEGEPELAFELLRRVWRQGYPTEASLAVLDWARSSVCERLWTTVWDWNTASRRVLAKAPHPRRTWFQQRKPDRM